MVENYKRYSTTKVYEDRAQDPVYLLANTLVKTIGKGLESLSPKYRESLGATRGISPSFESKRGGWGRRESAPARGLLWSVVWILLYAKHYDIIIRYIVG
jgi:hypothetical protein